MAQAAQSNQSNISDGLLVKMHSHIVILVKLDLCLHLYRPKLGLSAAHYSSSVLLEINCIQNFLCLKGTNIH